MVNNPTTIHLIRHTPYHPPFLIIDNKKIYPIVAIKFEGKFLGTENKQPDLSTPRVLINGYVRWVDIFQIPHMLKVRQDNTPEGKWKKRSSALDSHLSKIGRDPDPNPLKKLPPWSWNDVPEDEWPSWMLN